MSEDQARRDARLDEALERLAMQPVAEPDLDAALRSIRARLAEEEAPRTSPHWPWWIGAGAAAAAAVLVWFAMQPMVDRSRVPLDGSELDGSVVAQSTPSALEPVEQPDVEQLLLAAFGGLPDPQDARALSRARRELERKLGPAGGDVLASTTRELLERGDLPSARAALRYWIARADGSQAASIVVASRRAELAREALAALPGIGATGWRELERALRDERFANAIEVLGERRDERSVRLLSDALLELDPTVEPERAVSIVHGLLAQGEAGAQRLFDARLARRRERHVTIEAAVATSRDPRAVEALRTLVEEREYDVEALLALAATASPESFDVLVERFTRGRGPAEAVDAALGAATGHGSAAWAELAARLEGDTSRATGLLECLVTHPDPAVGAALARLVHAPRVPIDARLLGVQSLADSAHDSDLIHALSEIPGLPASDLRVAAALVAACAERFGSVAVLNALVLTSGSKARLAALLEDRDLSHASRIVRIARELGGVSSVLPSALLAP
jgi:hypothetical protein